MKPIRNLVGMLTLIHGEEHREGVVRDVKVGFTPAGMDEVRGKIRDLLAM